MMSSLLGDTSVLLHIIGFLDISTILDLRRSCKSIHGLISRYEYSIARAAEVSAWHEKVDDGVKYLSVSSLSDLIRLNIARQLAIKMVASRQLLRFYENYYCAGIALEDRLGNEIRDCVTRGLMLVYEFHRLYAGLGSTTPGAKDTLFDSIKHTVRGQSSQSRKADIPTLRKPLSQYASTLVADDITALTLVNSVMRGKILYEGRISESCEGSPPLWLQVKAEGEYSAVEWLVAFMLLQGPVFVKKFWSQDATVRNIACESIMIGCKKRTWRDITLERTAIFPMIINGSTKIYSPPKPNTRDIPREARAYYISVYKFRRGPLPAEISWEDRIKIRQNDLLNWVNMCDGGFTAIPKHQWMKAKYRNRGKPVVFFDQESQDLQ